MYRDSTAARIILRNWRAQLLSITVFIKISYAIQVFNHVSDTMQFRAAQPAVTLNES
jgi:hypothetical protein